MKNYLGFDPGPVDIFRVLRSQTIEPKECFVILAIETL